jgi:hypothetical protein
VRRVGNGQKTFLHPDVGTMTLGHEVMEINRTDGGRVVVYTAEPGTPDYDAMVLLDMKGAGALDAATEAAVISADALTEEKAEAEVSADGISPQQP